MPRRNCHCSDVSSIHLPWRASAACLGNEASTQRAALSPAWTIWGRAARPAASPKARLLNMGTSFIRTPGLDGGQQRSARRRRRVRCGFLVRPILMTWSAAVYCTQVDPITVMVCYTAPWFSPSYSRRPLACVTFGGGMIADARVLSAFHRLTTGTFTNALEG